MFIVDLKTGRAFETRRFCARKSCIYVDFLVLKEDELHCASAFKCQQMNDLYNLSICFCRAFISYITWYLCFGFGKDLTEERAQTTGGFRFQFNSGNYASKLGSMSAKVAKPKEEKDASKGKRRGLRCSSAASTSFGLKRPWFFTLLPPPQLHCIVLPGFWTHSKSIQAFDICALCLFVLSDNLFLSCKRWLIEYLLAFSV